MLMTSGFPDGPHIHHLPDIAVSRRQRLHGSGRISPLEPVVAGDYAEVEFHFDLGETPIPVGGRLGVAWLWPYDWAELQSDDPGKDGYVTVACTRAEVRLKPTYSFRGDLIPWNHQIDLEVTAGTLQRGDQVRLVCGARAGGGKGWRTPTFVVPQAEFLLLINPQGDKRWLQLPPVPSFPIVAGPPARLVALAPSQACPGQEIELTIRVEDSFGNPLLVENTPQLVSTEQYTSTAVESTPGMPAYRCQLRFNQAGTHRIDVHLRASDLDATTNPIQVAPEQPPLRLFWGDVHAGQGEIGCGIGSVTHHFDYARHVAGLHFATHQSNDHHVSLDLWEQLRRESAAAHEEGRFVTLLGCEWSAYTPEGGDRNVFYRHDEPRLRRSGRFFTEDVPDPEPDQTTATAFHQAMADQQVLINLHAGGRPTNLDFHAPKIEPLAEIHSTHGTSDWFVEDALRRGYRIGITAGTDGVAGRPGADHPGSRMIRNVRNGVTALYAADLSREAVWEALAARRCYATSGPRILLHVAVDGHLMGSEYATDKDPKIELAVEGTAALEQIDLLCGPRPLWQWRPQPALNDTLRILWGGTEACGSAPDQRALWDGRLTIRNGRVKSCDPVAFVSPFDQLQLADPYTVTWRSVTAGNSMGFNLKLEGNGSTLCRFESGPSTFEFALSQVRTAPMLVDAGGVSRRVRVGPAPALDGPRQVELSYRDTRALSGPCPYWVRVTQVDQQQAWSSPVYVERQAQAGTW